MKLTKRITALLLTICIVIGLLPATAWAANETTYVLAGSDFQARKGHSEGAGTVSTILGNIVVDYPTMDGFLFAGDYDVNYDDSANGKATLQEAVQEVYGEGMHEVYGQGNHDADNLVGTTLNASGANDASDYGVFLINEKDYMWYNDDEATIKNTASKLETYLNTKRNAGYKKPIFVVSHLPLHYNMRTRTSGNGDGKYANYIFDVLNEAGAAGLNIIFLFGHNHSNGWDDYLGGASVFLKKGDKINIAQSSTTVFEEETLAFTYMNAGYVGYYGDSYTSSVDKTLTMTTFAITDTSVTISRYDANGVHDLKSKGVENKAKTEYADSKYYSPDENVLGSPYVLTLNTNITPAGTEVVKPEDTNLKRTYTRVTSTSELVSGEQYLLFVGGNYFMLPEVVEKSNSSGSSRTGLDIESTSICGPDKIYGEYQEKEWTLTKSGTGWLLGNGSQSVRLTNNYTQVTATFSNSGSVFTIGGSENQFTFQSGRYYLNHNSRGLINGYNSDPATFYIYRMTNEGTETPKVDRVWGDEWKEISAPTPGKPAVEPSTKYIYELYTDNEVSEDNYLIVNTGSNGDGFALANVNGTATAQPVTISESKIKVEANDKTKIDWEISGRNNSYTLKNQNRYIYTNSNSVSLNTSSNSMTITRSSNGAYKIYRRDSSGRKTYYYGLTYDNKWTANSKNNTNQVPNVYLFKYTGTEVTPGQEATPGKDGLYVKIKGALSYTVTPGMTSEEAIALVKSGIDGYYYEASSKPDSNVAGNVWNDDELNWSLDVAYDGVTPGEYAVTITRNDVVLGVAKVVVPKAEIQEYSVEPAEGKVEKGSSLTQQTGAIIYAKIDEDTYYTVPVTVGMLTNAEGMPVSTNEKGTYKNLTLTYDGVVITNNFVLTVTGRTGNNYPEYPNEGAVKVNKTATGIDFQASGIAQVELSTSGVPVKKGADVIVMLDLSSSMENEVAGKQRIDVLEESLLNLVHQLQGNGEDGQPLDIQIAIADFNRYYTDTSSPYYLREDDHLASGEIRKNTQGTNKVYTGDGKLDATAFVDVHNVKDSQITQLALQSGTNYDYAFDAVYQLGEAINAKNAKSGEERDLFVVFMSDGAPFQFNYFSAQSGSDTSTTAARYWNNWLTGTLTDSMKYANARNDYYNAEGKHWMAEAIKGDPSKTYSVIRKNDATDTDNDTWVQVPGLGATMYSIGFCLQQDKEITVDSMDRVIRKIASEEKYYFRADSASDLSSAFSNIGNDIIYAAQNARFVDKMGGHFNLQMATSTYKLDATTTKTLAPVIEVLIYDIYTRQDYLNGKVTADKVGDRKGTKSLYEVVKFSADGTKAYSNLVDVDGDGKYGVIVNSDGTYSIGDTDDNIFGQDKVIYAKSFFYNAGIQAVEIDGINIPTDVQADGTTTGSSNRLASETFYWNLGTVTTTEWALRYYVYLEGSMEGTAKEGSYATNEYATIYYQNYLDNDCKLDTTSPTLAWKAASVSFAFYLVNEDGEIIVNQTTGETGSFAHKIAVTNPVLYKTLLLNNTEQVSALSVEAISDDVLPPYYTLYDEDAVYSVTINSNSTGKWEISKGNVSQNSTYVTQYKTSDASAYSNALYNDTAGDDYTHTVVWFAVVWTLQAHPDSVVVDYGLPVDISVLTNDMFGGNGKLVAVGPYREGQENSVVGKTLQEGFGNEYKGVYGTAKVNAETGKVRYTLNKSNGMQMQTYEKFSYAVNYLGNNNSGYYYDTVTVIPATTVYYEEDYVTLESFTWQNGWKQKDTSLWSIAGETINGVQTEDRPGRYSLEDANNIYGYDSVNLNMSTYSMGSAMKATVDYDNMAQASFEFYGTGFDVISLASVDTGMIYVDVYDENGVKLQDRCHLVDTYYGYKYENGEWIVDATVTDTMYQIPAIKIEGLEYGKYKAVIRAIWEPIYDHVEGSRTFDFYLDAIRIYDPTNNGNADGSDDTTIEDAYYMDGESWPSYMEVRDLLLEAKSFDGVANEVLPDDIKMEGLVFIDGDESVGNAQIEDYSKYGPNNEVYIAPGQRVAFILSTPENIKNVHVGIKSADGRAATYTITNIARYDSADGKVQAGDWYGAQTFSINTTTDMYRDLTDWRHDIIVISNTGNRYNTTGVISVTNIKSTYETEPQMTDGTTPELAYMYMTPRTAMLTLRALNTPNVEEVPEETTPVAPQPGVVTPDNIGSEGNTQEKVEESNTTVSTEVTSKTEEDASTKQETEVLVDGVTEEVEENESTSKSFGEVIKSIIEKIVNFIQKVFNWLFGWLVD